MSAATAHRTEPTTSTRRPPAVALLALVVLAVALAGCMPEEERTFLDRTNALRASVGVPSLQEHDTLTEKAEAWAQHMASTGRLEHSNLSSGLGGLGWRSLGENVGMSSTTANTLLSIHNWFTSSSGHRQNLVNSRFTHMGVGVATDRSGRVWVAEVFAQL